MRLINKIKRKLQYLLAKYTRPHIIGGFTRFDGVYLKNTRIGNTTFIDNVEKLYLEDNIYIGHYNFIEASNSVFIGEGCQITNYITITSHSSHISIRLYGKAYSDFNKLEGYVKGAIKIGSYTFIGPNSVIMPGTEIGKGSIVSAFSYVKGVFPDFSIISGNPAKVVGDTRKLDKVYLDQFPELKKYYEQWAN